MATICIDLDGVVAGFKRDGQTYADVAPIPGAVEKLQGLKSHGHRIILYTARHMKTCEGNVGLVMARVGNVTLDWLKRHDVPYDEIYFGKPWADVYVDDNAFRFRAWDEIAQDGSNLPQSNEKSHDKTKTIP
jgi:capsule biosynthesis phosphatase